MVPSLLLRGRVPVDPVLPPFSLTLTSGTTLTPVLKMGAPDKFAPLLLALFVPYLVLGAAQKLAKSVGAWPFARLVSWGLGRIFPVLVAWAYYSLWLYPRWLQLPYLEQPLRLGVVVGERPGLTYAQPRPVRNSVPPRVVVHRI